MKVWVAFATSLWTNAKRQDSPFVLGPWERLRFQVFRSRLRHNRNVEFHFDLIFSVDPVTVTGLGTASSLAPSPPGVRLL